MSLMKRNEPEAEEEDETNQQKMKDRPNKKKCPELDQVNENAVDKCASLDKNSSLEKNTSLEENSNIEKISVKDTTMEESKKTLLEGIEELNNQTGQREEQVGITQFINNDTPTFTAIIKHRFTDFIVHEVNTENQVIRLRNISKPPTPARVVPSNEWPEQADEQLKEILGESKIKLLKEMVTQGPSHAQRKKGGKDPGESSTKNLINNVVTDPIESKEQRKQVHQVVRELFGGRLITEHKQIDDSNVDAISISWAKPGKNYERRPRVKDDKPDYIHFTLQKTNRETQDALSIISRQLHCNVSRDLAICGTKDKRSVSCQRVSLKRGRRTIEDLWFAFNNNKDIQQKERGLKGIRLGDFSYEKHPLKLGQLNGNRFTIVLRDVIPAEPEILKSAIKTLTTYGFLNYFGMQRFGTTSIGTHLIGLSLLRSEWELAIDLIMRKKIGETQEIELARSVWFESKDAKAALNLMPKRCVAERCILEFFSKQKGQTDKCGALASIPKNLRMMYIHAYQSYVWNTMLSRRVSIYGYEKPVIGDIVQIAGQDQNLVDEEGLQDESSNKCDKSDSVKILQTAENCDQFTIHDVVLPLPGYSILYPKNELADHYFDLLKQDGLNPDQLSRPQAEYSMGGAYRKIIHLPSDVKYEFYEYDDPDLALTQADEDELLGMELATVKVWRDEESPKEIKNLALKLEFSLASSTYATMALREILKSDTSKNAQSRLTRELRDRISA